MKVYLLDEGQKGVRLDRDTLPDLDMLMLDIWRDIDNETEFRYGDPDEESDHPTRFAQDAEPAWQWTKMSPCYCGEHGWHWDSRSADTWPKRHLDAGLVEGEPDMIADRPKGRFIALEWAQ
jgi:hypothetical protein